VYNRRVYRGSATNTGRVYRKRRRMLQTRVGYIEKEEKCYTYKPIGGDIGSNIIQNSI
jgi:hypothetical protein